jgi:hypothetical protein
MGAAVSITRFDLTALELRKAASGEKNSAAARRILGKRDFPRTLTPAVLTDGLRICGASGLSGSGGFVEVEGQQVDNIGVAGALRQFGEDVAQPR